MLSNRERPSGGGFEYSYSVMAKAWSVGHGRRIHWHSVAPVLQLGGVEGDINPLGQFLVGLEFGSEGFGFSLAACGGGLSPYAQLYGCARWSTTGWIGLDASLGLPLGWWLLKQAEGIKM
ncbi:hypothetical protein ACFL6C_07680 [Myxococcota bacterium]